MTPRRAPELYRNWLVTLVALLVPAATAYALPEDAEQPIEVDADRTEVFLNDGLFVYTGSQEAPACITQGTMKICGVEIRLERADNGELRQVTATGSPARFQQQLEADQELVHASGARLVFDNVAQLVTADGDAELSQSGDVINHQHIEYDIEARHYSASGADGERGSMRVNRAPGN
jgi:lipopolysaccharide export system protein LptA